MGGWGLVPAKLRTAAGGRPTQPLAGTRPQAGPLLLVAEPGYGFGFIVKKQRVRIEGGLPEHVQLHLVAFGRGALVEARQISGEQRAIQRRRELWRILVAEPLVQVGARQGPAAQIQEPEAAVAVLLGSGQHGFVGALEFGWRQCLLPAADKNP